MVKRFKKTLFIVLLVVILIGVFAACNNDDGNGDPVDENKVVSVVVNHDREYNIGKLNDSGITMTVTYENGDVKTVPFSTDYVQVKDQYLLEQTGDKILHVVYGNVGAYLNVKLIGAEETRGIYITYYTDYGTAIPTERKESGYQIQAFKSGDGKVGFYETSRLGYRLKGWFIDFYNNNHGYYTPTSGNYPLTLTSDTKFYADWELMDIRVTFHTQYPEAGVGAATFVQQTKALSGSITKPEPSASADAVFKTVPGWTFGGWYTDTNCTNPYSWISNIGADDFDLYAKWTQDKYTLSFDANGGAFKDGVASKLEGFTYGNSIADKAIEASDLTRDHFMFAGWYTKQNPVSTDIPFNFTNATITSDITLYAKWDTIDSFFETKANLDGTLTITGINSAVTGNIYNITIPSTIGGKVVSAIAANAFSGRLALVSVVYGTGDENLLSIGENAFNACPNLVEFNMPSSVVYVGAGAIPASSVWYKAQGNYVTVGQVLYKYKGNAAYLNMNTGDIENYTTDTLNSNIKYIASGAFGLLENLKGIYIADSIVRIESNAFVDDVLQKAQTPLETIYFTALSNLASVHQSAFTKAVSKPELTAITGVDNQDAYIVYKGILIGTTHSFATLTEIHIPAGVWMINDNAFNTFSNVTKLVFREDVLAAGDDAETASKYASKYDITYVGYRAFAQNYLWATSDGINNAAAAGANDADMQATLNGDAYATIGNILVGVRYANERFDIPSYIDVISPGAFINSENTKNIVFTDAVQIMVNAFTNMKNVNITFVNDALLYDVNTTNDNSAFATNTLTVEEGAFLVGPDSNQKIFFANNYFDTFKTANVWKHYFDYTDSYGKAIVYKLEVDESSLAIAGLRTAFPEDSTLVNSDLKIERLAYWINYDRNTMHLNPRIVFTRNDGATYTHALEIENFKDAEGHSTYVEFDTSSSDELSVVFRYLDKTYPSSNTKYMNVGSYSYTVTATFLSAVTEPMQDENKLNMAGKYYRKEGTTDYVVYDPNNADHQKAYDHEIYFSTVRQYYFANAAFNPTGLRFTTTYTDNTESNPSIVWKVVSFQLITHTHGNAVLAEMNGEIETGLRRNAVIYVTTDNTAIDNTASYKPLDTSPTSVGGSYWLIIQIGDQHVVLQDYFDVASTPQAGTQFTYSMTTSKPTTVEFTNVKEVFAVGETIVLDTTSVRLNVLDQSGAYLSQIHGNNKYLDFTGMDLDTTYDPENLKTGDYYDAATGLIRRTRYFSYYHTTTGDTLTGAFTYYVEFATPQSFFTFNIINGTEAEITGLATTHPTEIVIPAFYTAGDVTYNVVGIADNAFANIRDVHTIHFHDGLRYFGASSFRGMTSLKEVILPKSVASIGASAFEGTVSLTSFTLKLSGNATDGFYYESALTEIPEGMFIGSGIVEFMKFDNAYPVTYSIAKLGRSAFLSATKLNYVNFGTEATYDAIPNSLFQGAISLEAFVISANVLTIGDLAFSGSGIKQIAIPGSVYSIGEKAFDNAISLAVVTFANNGANLKLLGAGAFQSTVSLTSVSIPTGITTLPANAFKLSGIKGTASEKIVIPANITRIGDYAFEGSQLAYISFAGANVALGNGIFARTPNLQAFTFPANVSSIPAYTFEGSGLKNFTITESILDIRTYAFSKSAIETLTLTSATGLKTIYEYAFSYCASLKTVDFTGATNLESVNDNAFFGCTLTSAKFTGLARLSKVSLNGSGLVEIVAMAFQNTPSLTSFTIPSTVKTIGASAFSNGGLTYISIPATVTTIGDGAFAGCSNFNNIDLSNAIGLTSLSGFARTALKTIAIPSQVRTIGEKAFEGNLQLTSVDMSNAKSLSVIGKAAFANCPLLTEFSIPQNLEVLERIFNYDYAESAALQTAVAVVDTTNALTLRRVENFAFYQNSKIKEFAIPEKLQEIGKYAFASSSIEKVDTSRSQLLTKIDNGAFMNTSNLEGFTMPDSLATLSGGGGGVYSWDLTNMLNNSTHGAFEGSGIKYFTISRGLVLVEQNAVGGCKKLETIDFSNASSLTKIMLGGFFENSSLKEIDLSGATKLQVIDGSAFISNTNVTKIVIGPAVHTIGQQAFGTQPGGSPSGPGGKQAGWTSYEKTVKTIDLSRADSLYNIGAYAFTNGEYVNGVYSPVGQIVVEVTIAAANRPPHIQDSAGNWIGGWHRLCWDEFGHANLAYNRNKHVTVVMGDDPDVEVNAVTINWQHGSTKTIVAPK